VTSSPLCHQNNVTKIFQFRPLPIKISGYASGLGLTGLGLEKIGGLGLVT